MALELRKRMTAAPLAALVATVITLGVAFSAPLWAQQIEYWIFDRFQSAKPRVYDPDTPVRIVDIDSAALAGLGQWPWPRTYVAEMLDRLTELGAAAVTFDILFAEPDRTSPERAQDAWARFGTVDMPQLKTLPNHDSILSEAIARAPVVLGSILANVTTQPIPKASVSTVGPSAEPHLPYFPGAEINLVSLEDAATGIGSMTLSDQVGGVVRTVPLLTRTPDAILPGLSIEALRVAQGQPGFIVKTVGASGEQGFGTRGIVSLRVGDFEIPTRSDGTLWVRYAGSQPERMVSAAPLLGPDWRSLKPQIEGRIIIIGTSAPGLRDLVTTPLMGRELGAVVHAEAIEQIIAQDFLVRPDWARGAEIVLIALGGVLMAIFAGLASALWSVLALALWIGAVIQGAWYSFDTYGLLLSPFWSVAGALFAWSAGSLLNFRIADREKSQVRAQFAQFLAPDVVDEIAANPERYLTPGGVDREITILFIDIRNFSTLSRDMNSQELIAYLNSFLTPVSDAIIEEGGTIDKYIGDAVMAFWNAPKPRPDHRAKALDAVLAIRKTVSALNEQHRRDGRPEVAFGVGVNTGVCAVGAIGSYRRLDYTCIGDAVNTAARLESLTKQYGLDACISERVATGAQAYALVELDFTTVVGRDRKPEKLFAVLGDAVVACAPRFQAIQAQTAQALECYRTRRFAEAVPLFETLAETEPQLAAYAAIMAGRADAYRADPPPAGWDGVSRPTVK